MKARRHFRLPPGVIRRRLLSDALFLWLGVRVFALLFPGGETPSPFLPAHRTSMVIMTAAVFLCFVQVRRFKETDLLRNRPLDVEALLDSRPGRMSGGKRRRAEIWLAVAAASTCLIADEPFLGIAPADRDKVAEALRSLAATGAAILVTGHEVEDLFDLADEVIWMVAGTTHGLGTPDEAARHAQFRLEYLGTRALPS